MHIILPVFHILYVLYYPYFTYCNIVWGSNYLSRLKSLQKVQKNIIRLITFSKPLFIHLKILDIFQLNTFLISLFMYSQRTKKLPNTFNDYFLENNHLHYHNTRSAKKLHVKYYRTNYGKFSLKVRYGMSYLMRQRTQNHILYLKEK